jgi:uncharacterized protein YjbI with pentapeptide repeats
MTAPTDSPTARAWPTCQAVNGCRGIQVGDSDACLAHLDESQLADWLATLGPGSHLDLRGTQVEAMRLTRLLTTLHDEHGRPCLGDTLFEGAQFSGGARFDGAQFSGAVWFGRAQFSGDARFSEAQLTRAVTLGPLLVRGTLSFTSASFEDTVVVEAVAARVHMDRATCAASIGLQLRYAEVTLDGVRLAQPMTLAAANPFTWTTASGPEFDETAFAQPGRSPAPHLLSVRATDVATLVVTDLSLAPCRFAGAHHLDQLRLEGAIRFAQPPRGLRVGRARPPVWWWTRRQTLAEEHTWRATRPKGTGWYDRETQPPPWLEQATGPPPRVIGPERLAGLYRALRQAQESRKNEPGAADFYYGEMEMRRLASSTLWAERAILFGYWLVAGYGLRGLRALAALGVIVVTLAGLFHAVGFAPIRPASSWWDSLLYTAGSTLSISDDTLKLTAWGKLLRIVLRLLGPLLLGLALLSVRNRVKR